MLVVVRAISGGASVQQVHLRSDQILKVGRSGWADLSVNGDQLMLEEHFEVQCTPEGCVVRALSPDAPTLLNGEAVLTALAYDGDQIRAGATTFELVIQGGPPRPSEETPEAENSAAADGPEPSAAQQVAVGAAMGLAGVCAYLEFGDEVQALADSSDSADVLIDELSAQEKFQDALRLRAYLLEKRQAVWWGCYCLREELHETLPTVQSAAVAAAFDWVKDPSEANRRAAEAKAGDAKYSGPGATLALSAFWSTGSLAPEGSPEVEADERLTSQGVAASLVAAAYVGDPTKAPDRFRAFLDRGGDVASGKIKIPNDA